MLFIYVMLFISGSALGSFYNVVALRLLKNESIVKPASHCPKCMHRLVWYELIPVFSYMFLRGKCHKCKTSISIIYPLIEVFMGALFCFSYYRFGFSLDFLTAIVISSILVIIYITDFKEFIILDEVLYFGGISLIVIKFLQSGLQNTLISILYGIILFILFYLLKIFGDKLFKQESLGGGDIKLAFIIGFILGMPLGLFNIVLASFLAFPYAIITSITNKVKEVPFGPFLITALFVMFFKYDFFLKILEMLKI